MTTEPDLVLHLGAIVGTVITVGGISALVQVLIALHGGGGDDY